MALSIELDSQPEFYTNLDQITGKICLALPRQEQLGSIVVKLEGESKTALMSQDLRSRRSRTISLANPDFESLNLSLIENHKLLYRVQQVFPGEYYATTSNPYGSYPLPAGEHEFPFNFKVPINNACGDSEAMARTGGVAGGDGLFGIGGVRVMDGSKQLWYRHVTQTLPPSLTGYNREAEVKYYIKVTVQRPGLLKENWRLSTDFKFLPLEPPRPEKTRDQEAYARRPFTFRPRSNSVKSGFTSKRASFFKKSPDKAQEAASLESSAPDQPHALAPSVEISARLPFPSILTCNKPIPLRLIAKKLVDHPDEVYLAASQIDIVGTTTLRARSIEESRINRWTVASKTNALIPIGMAKASLNQEVLISDHLWVGQPLPNTIAPSFLTCNITRTYALELKLGLMWGEPSAGGSVVDQVIHLPLRFDSVEVYSGIPPPAQLLQAVRDRQANSIVEMPPRQPPRLSVGTSAGRVAARRASLTNQAAPRQPPRPPRDPLYPPQLPTGQDGTAEAPPSYDEAIADGVPGPFDTLGYRPAFSGVTDEHAASTLTREKS